MSLPISLSDLLSVSIVLRNIVLYLPFSTLCRLAQTCKDIRTNLRSSPDAYKYVDLSNTMLANCCPTLWNTIDYGSYGNRRCDRISNVTAHDGMAKISNGDKNDTRWLTSRMKKPQSSEAFCSRPARLMLVYLGRAGILQHVQALVLDNAMITANSIVHDILIPIDEGRLTIRLLSIRKANFTNGNKLAAMLKDYALTGNAKSGVSDKLPRSQEKGEGSPQRVKGLYLFNRPMTAYELKMAEQHQTEIGLRKGGNSTNVSRNEELKSYSAKRTDSGRNLWYEQSGFLIHGSIAPYWVDTLRVCANETGALAFDAVICRGPRHNRDILRSDKRLESLACYSPRIATAALGPDGCRNCGSAPEGFAYSQGTPGPDVPLLTPLPKARMTVREAKRPSPPPNPAVRGDCEERRTIMRCEMCLDRRYCSTCNRWWCEFCYNTADVELQVSAEVMMKSIMASRDSAFGDSRTYC